MKYIFIVNPEAGDYSSAQVYVAYIDRYCQAKKLNYKIYTTEDKDHAYKIVKKESSKGDRVRIYGFGGDGTLHDMASAAINKPNIEIGIFSFGSGNDYIRTFSEDIKIFRDIDAQMLGDAIDVDVIKANNNMLAFNQCSIGMDANVAMKMNQFKNWPLVSGPMAYNLAIVKCILLSKINCYMEIVVDDDKKYSGEFLFALVGNGQYYGGGYKGAPEAEVNDGLLDFVIMRKFSKVKFIKNRKIYQKGEHLGSEEFKDNLIYIKGKKIRIKTNKPVSVTYDGECYETSEVSMEIMPKALKFIIPRVEEDK